jgi:hypothetical protein
VKICVEPTQSGFWAAHPLAYWATRIRSGREVRHLMVGSTAGTSLGTPMSTLARSSAITTFPAVSTAATAAVARPLTWANAAISSAALSRARPFSVLCVWVTAWESHLPVASGSGVRQQEMLSTAIGSRVTTSRTAMAAHAQLWNAWHQCSAPLIRTGPCVSSAVPMPFVPAPASDQQDQVARLASAALATVAWSPQVARIRPVASATVTMPLRPSTSRAMAPASPPSSVSTTSCSSVWSLCAAASGASVRCGSTRYCSRQRCQETTTSGRTPRT